MPRLIDTVRAVAFDLDGTLVDSAPDLAAAANLMLTMLGAQALPEARIRALIGDGIDQLVRRALTESLGRPPSAAHCTAARLLFGKLYGQHLFERSRTYPHVSQALQALTDAGLALACATNKEAGFAYPLLAASGLEPFFLFTLCADRAEDRKPSPNLLLAACRHLNVSPSELAYVGDAHTDVLAARAAGCRAVAVTYGYHHGPALEEFRPDAIVAGLMELTEIEQPAPPYRPELTLARLRASSTPRPGRPAGPDP
jgi:phosphoglycolate phosphatase